MSGTPTNSVISELRSRNLLHQVTDEAGLAAHLGVPETVGGRVVYCGFDPTADSLTIGNLVPIMLLAHFQRAGHTPVVLMGGGTGLIGDPSGKTAERQLRTREEVEGNVRSQMRIFQRILSFDQSKPNHARLVNNADWLCKVGYIDMLRDVGKHFSVNMMIQKDSVKDRLHNRDQGISYTEFSYMILQAYDYLVLWRDFQALGLPKAVTIQCGGSDQWGNMVGGTDLIRKIRLEISSSLAQLLVDIHTELPISSDSISDPVTFICELAKMDLAAPGCLSQALVAMRNFSPEERSSLVDHIHHCASLCFCLTAPLVTKADGGKFGKSEAGAVWLTAERTSPFAYYQFWLNTADADVVRFLKTFTFLPLEEISRLEESLKNDPGKREAQKVLAREATRILHGEEELAKAEAATSALFGKKNTDQDGPFVLPDDILSSAPSSTHDSSLLDGAGMSLVDLLAQTTLAKSKTEARTLLGQNSISVNGKKVTLETRLTRESLMPSANDGGGTIAIRRGSKAWHITRWT